MGRQALTMSIIRAGAAYFAIVFAIGFVLGTVRVLLLAPSFGVFTATMLEAPIMLAASWIVCGRVVRWFAVEPQIPARLLMGLWALVLLFGAEVLLGLYGFGRSLAEQFVAIGESAGLVGLASQLAFAIFPVLRR